SRLARPSVPPSTISPWAWRSASPSALSPAGCGTCGATGAAERAGEQYDARVTRGWRRRTRSPIGARSPVLAAMSPPPAAPTQSLTPIIWILGLGQLVGFGTIFYSFALVAPGPSAEFGVSLPVLFAVLSVATLISGLVGPQVGRLIDT